MDTPTLSVPMVIALLLAWPPLVVVLFRTVGKWNATLIAVIGGETFLPQVAVVAPWWPVTLDKELVTAIGLLLALLIWDRRTLLRFRPQAWDIPFLLFIAYMVSLWLGGVGGPGEDFFGGSYAARKLACWVVPYVAARLYFGSLDGALRIGIGVVVGGLAYVPIVFYETLAGPDRYLKTLLYGLRVAPEVAERLGGWRPEGFFSSGLSLAAWMALTAVLALWLWLGGTWRPRRGPAWWPSLVLVLATLATRGVYAYLTLGLGVVAVALTVGLRTRLALVALMVIAPVYIAGRVTGVMDEQILTRVAGLASNRAGTVAFRLEAEDRVVGPVLAHNPLFGLGCPLRLAPRADWRPTNLITIDGAWLYLLLTGGLAAVMLQHLALSLVPAGAILFRPRGRPDRDQAGSPAWGLALVLLLVMDYNLHNWTHSAVIALADGALIGLLASGHQWEAVTRRGDASSRKRPAAARSTRALEPATGLDPAAATAAVSCALYVFYAFGHVRGGDRSAMMLVGGLGSAPVFAAAGWLGAWASERLPLARLTAFAAAFAVLGTSFSLALHATVRPLFLADILQCLALCVLLTAVWLRFAGDRPWTIAALAVVPLVVHLVFRPAGILPTFPGSAYFYTGYGSREGQTVYAVCPWLALAALGAWARREGAGTVLAAAAMLGAGCALAVWFDPTSGWPLKQPMNLSYGLLALSVAAASLAAGRAIAQARGPLPGAVLWLGRHWLVYFYLHFAVSTALGSLPISALWVLWFLEAVATVALTWLVVTATRPLAGLFCLPAVWIGLLSLILVVGIWPGLPVTAVLAGAGGCGVLFAAHAGELAKLCLGAPSDITRDRAQARPWWSEARRGSAESPMVDTPLRAAGRLAVVVALLALPEVVAWLTTASPSRPGPPASARRRTDAPDRCSTSITASLTGSDAGSFPMESERQGARVMVWPGCLGSRLSTLASRPNRVLSGRSMFTKRDLVGLLRISLINGRRPRLG